MEFFMSIKTRIAALALAALAVTGSIATTTTPAEARGLRWGIGAGLVGAAVVGSAIAASNDGYYYGGYCPCRRGRHLDSFRNYLRPVPTPTYSCNHPHRRNHPQKHTNTSHTPPPPHLPYSP